MKLTRICGRIELVGVLCAVAACGGGSGGGSSSPPPATIRRTLAYVVTECREYGQEVTGHHALRIQQGDADPITVEEFDTGPYPAPGLCAGWGLTRDGPASVVVIFFQRLAISPDGSTVVFEVTDEFSLFHLFVGPGSLLPEEKKGFFSVHTDGSGLRRLGPASREATFRAVPDSSVPTGHIGWMSPGNSMFSPNGKRITFTDLGPGPTGKDVIQIFMMDVDSGVRTQLTSLPPLTSITDTEVEPPVFPGFFLDDDTIQFQTFAKEEATAYTLKVSDCSQQPCDTSKLTTRQAVAIPGSVFLPNLAITGLAANVFPVGFFGEPDNPLYYYDSLVNELFVSSDWNLSQLSGGPLLQLTNFNRSDTNWYGALLSPDRQRVLFMASADPLGTNPQHNCQIFSIDTLGTNLRQLTDFALTPVVGGTGAETVGGGCLFPFAPDCLSFFVGADVATDSVLFYSSCDPLQRNPWGGQLFAMHFDGSGLRQLTDFKRMVTEPDGTVTVELPGPFAVLPPTQ